MAKVLGKEVTLSKVLRILYELLQDENAEVRLNVVSGLFKIAQVIGQDLLDHPGLLSKL